MATVNYSWNLPTVGGSEDAWGTQLNANWTALDTLLGGTNATEFAILDGATVSTAELNLLDGVTWTLTDYNTLTATATELNLLDGVTGKTGADTTLVTGTAGTDGQYAQWNADGDVVGVALPTLPEADWETGTSTTEAIVSPAKAKAGAVATIDSEFNVSGSAPKYACRAWVTFNDSGTILASGNVSGVTKNGNGDFTVTFATAMPDANYAVSVTGSRTVDSGAAFFFVWDAAGAQAAGSVRVGAKGDSTSTGATNVNTMSVMVFR